MHPDSLYGNNLRTFTFRFPKVAALLRRLRHRRWEPGREGTDTMEVELLDAVTDGIRTARGCRTGALVHSRFDPRAEAEEIARQALASGARRFLVFGFGLGYHIQSLLASHDGVDEAAVFEFNPALLEAAMQAGDLTELFRDPRLHLHLPESTEAFAKEILELHHTEYQLLYHRPSLHLTPESMRAAVDIVEGLSVEKMNVVRRSNEMEENRQANRGAVMAAPGVETLFGRLRGRGAIVVAAGPSLDKTLADLSLFRGQVAVIAVNAIFRKIVNAGLRPSVVVCVESRPEIVNDFEGLWGSDVPLVFLPTTQHRVVSRYEGPKIVAYAEGDRTLGPWARSFPKGRLKSGLGSASGTAIDLAIKMKANPILFTGLDLAFTDRRSYCRGVFAKESLRATGGPYTREVPAVGGGKVATSLAFHHARLAIENLILQVKMEDINRIFIDATDGGARIAGTRVMSLQAVSAALGARVA